MGFLSDIVSRVSAGTADIVARIEHDFTFRHDERQEDQTSAQQYQMQRFQQEALQTARLRSQQRHGGEIVPISLKDYYDAAKEIIERENADIAQGIANGTIDQNQYRDFPINEQGQPDVYNMRQFLNFSGTEQNPIQLRDIEFNRHDFTKGEWDEVERGLCFNHAELINVTFIPATTLDALHLDRSGSTVSIENAIFDGMENGDTLTLAAGNYEGISFINTNGGTLVLAPRAIVTDCTVTGAVMNIEMGENSSLVDLHTDNQTRIITFQAGRGARIEGADISGATISPNSQLANTQWVNVNLSSVNMRDVDFSGANFTQVTMDGQRATFDALIAAGVQNLPAAITDEKGTLTLTQYQTWQQEMARAQALQNREYAPGSPQALVMEAARNMACAVNGNGVETEEFKAQRTIQTQQAREGIDRANEAFCESMAQVRLREQLANKNS